jgi:hypothetical protein
MIRIAIFGDTHGHLRLMFQLARLWQINHRLRLDAILQCGDLGYFPHPQALDRATKKFAKEDAEELGFSRFFRRNAPTEDDPLLIQILSGSTETLETVTCPVLWCHGNHEDFQALEVEVGNRDRVAVDRFNRLEWIRPGHIIHLNGLTVASLGGGPEHGDVHAAESCNFAWQWVSDQATRRLLQKSFHLLISHAAPRGLGGETDQHGSAFG